VPRGEMKFARGTFELLELMIRDVSRCLAVFHRIYIYIYSTRARVRGREIISAEMYYFTISVRVIKRRSGLH